MRTIIKSIPNTITLLNVIAGSVAITYAFENNMAMAMLFIAIAAVLDFFDGFAARLLKAYSPLGKDLDSLADMLSFGAAPAIMLYVVSDGNYIVFVLAAFSALRLAKFNNDTRQTTSFIGLPTPANAFFFGSAAYLATADSTLSPMFNTIFTSMWGSSIVAVIFSLLLVCEIPMFSLKFKSYALKDNYIVYIFLAASAASLAIIKAAALPFIILVYILISIATSLYCKKCKK